MPWMDASSRPSQSQAAPPPFYLAKPDTKYCHTCGRVISEHKSHKTETTSTPAKYCSATCRSQKSSRDNDRKIERAFVALLDDEKRFEDEDVPDSVLEMKIKPRSKGEKRMVIPCSAAETLVYGSPTGRKRRIPWSEKASQMDDNPLEESVHEDDEVKSQLIDGNTTISTGEIHPPQRLSSDQSSVGDGKGRLKRTAESSEAAAKRLEGLQAAKEKETVKRAARRLCVFGFDGGGMDSQSKNRNRLCEAVMNGKVVEPSFAKGDWGIQWRE